MLLDKKQILLSCQNKTKQEIDQLNKVNADLKRAEEALAIPKSTRHDITKYVLSKADIVFTTLQNCSKLFKYATNIKFILYLYLYSFFRSIHKFDIAVIDEANQCNEQFSVMPLLFGIKHFLLVGETITEATLTAKVIEYILISN